MPNLGGKLSQKQERFVEHYALCGNAAEAARLAGYSAKTARQIATENLSKPSVKHALEARQRAFQQELGVTKESVISGVLSAIQMGREQGNPAVMIAGLVQVAKLCGFYEPERVALSMCASGNRLKAKYSVMTDEELVELIHRN